MKIFHNYSARDTRVPILIVLLGLLVAFFPSPSFAQEGKAVTFSSTDGVSLKGYLFGSGKIGVILAHMYPTDQKSWFPFAKELASKGYCAMTLDFRGYGESGGHKEVSEIDRDLEGAYLFLKATVEKIFLIGASMGGTAAIRVASHQPVAGVVCISGPASFRGLVADDVIEKIKAPILFLASEGDPGQAAASARLLHKLAPGKKDLLIVPGSDHGTYLFQGPNKDEVEKRILGFLKNP